MLGYPEHGVRYAQPEADFAAWASACGGYGAKVREPGEVRGAIEEALAYDGPALVDIDVDPNEPPMPGKIQYEQAKKFAEAFLKGQPHKAGHRDHAVQGQDPADQGVKRERVRDRADSCRDCCDAGVSDSPHRGGRQ